MANVDDNSRRLEKLNRKLNKISNDLAKTSIKLSNEANEELIIGANDMRNSIIKWMAREPKRGRTYKRGKRTHIASAPGQSPAVDYGELIKTIVFDVRRNEVEVGSKSGAPYAKYLEHGTAGKDGKPRILPRPFLSRAVKKHYPRILRRVPEVVVKEISSALTGRRIKK